MYIYIYINTVNYITEKIIITPLQIIQFKTQVSEFLFYSHPCRISIQRTFVPILETI